MQLVLNIPLIHNSSFDPGPNQFLVEILSTLFSNNMLQHSLLIFLDKGSGHVQNLLDVQS
jgi:hypothetical protein